MYRQVGFVLGSLFIPSLVGAEITESLHQQLGVQGYFYAPQNPETALVLSRRSEGRYLVCLSDDKKKHAIYELTENTFPDGAQRIIVYCKQDELKITKS